MKKIILCLSILTFSSITFALNTYTINVRCLSGASGSQTCEDTISKPDCAEAFCQGRVVSIDGKGLKFYGVNNSSFKGGKKKKNKKK